MSNVAHTSIAATLQLLHALGKAILAIARYDCEEAISILKALPHQQFNTGWTQTQIGKAYFEMADYKAADQAFRMARRIEPHRVSGMEHYSTVLWHLRKETALSYLAHEVIAGDRHSPEAWCVVGNCFSLQKEHDGAIKFFERAIQVDPTFTYAHTLLGHEYVYNEDFGKALVCFRNAIQYDSRHYNAWYGLGTIYYRQEKYDHAEHHFLKAVEINPKSPLLLCHLGMVKHAQNRPLEALAVIEKAVGMNQLNPCWVLVKFNKAKVLAALNRHHDALKELEELKQLAPKESSLYFLMGRIYKKLGQADKAMIHFTWAMNLDPRGSNNLLANDQMENYGEATLPDDLPSADGAEGDEV